MKELSRSERQFFASVMTLVQRVRWARDPQLQVFMGEDRKKQGEDDLVFTRKNGEQTLDVALVLDSDQRLMGGNIRLSDGPRAYRGGLAFDAQGRISNVAEGIQLEVSGIEKIDVLNLLYSAMDPEGFGQRINLRELLSGASQR